MVAAAGLLAGACQLEVGQVPRLDTLRQPTGLAVSPNGPVLLVTNGNWDRAQLDSTLVAIDLDALWTELGRPAPAGDRSRPCTRASDDDDTIECNPRAFIDPRTTIRLGTGAGNIAIDRPAGEDGVVRLLVPTRSPASVTWVDVLPADDGVRLDCGQDDSGRCGPTHELSSGMPGEPVRVVVDQGGARFAYVPHLLRQDLSLIDLDAEAGPELTDIHDTFFREDPFDEEELFGGFSVATRPCDPQRPASATRECVRPFQYSTHRFFPGLRQFTVAPGLRVILAGREVPVPVVSPEAVQGRPFMGDLAFEDETGDRLLVVQTTPPALLRLDTSLDDDGEPRDDVIATVPLCAEPNMLALARFEDAEPLALVACASAGRLAVVGLGSFRVLASVPVGQGAHEVVVDEGRRQAYVSNPDEDTISIVDLDPTSPRRFTAWARLGS